MTAPEDELEASVVVEVEVSPEIVDENPLSEADDPDASEVDAVDAVVEFETAVVPPVVTFAELRETLSTKT